MNTEKQLSYMYVAIHSLLQHYNGPVGFTHKNVGQRYLDELQKCGVECVEYSKHLSGRAQKRESWIGKAYAHNEHPFDVNLCYDLDCEFLKPITEEMFDIVQEHELSLIGYDTPPGHERKKRIHLSRAIGQEVGPLLAVNSGFTGSLKGSPKIDEWHNYMQLINKSGSVLRLNPEEWGLAAMRAFNRVHLADRSWCAAVLPEDLSENDIACHYMAGSAWKHKRWLAAAKVVVAQNFMHADDWGVFPDIEQRYENAVM